MISQLNMASNCNPVVSATCSSVSSTSSLTSFVSLNVNGLRDANKRMSFLFWLSQSPVDIVCLQELHVLSCVECTSWFSAFGFLSVCSPGSTHSCGTVILYRPKFVLSRSSIDPNGRFVFAEFRLDEISFRVVSLYAPNRNPGRDDFFRYVNGQIDPSVSTFVCGDFNAVFDRTLDRRGSMGVSFAHESCVTLKSLFDDCCLVDVWRALHPDVSAFSWMRSDGALASRIDLVGCPYAWLHCVESCSIEPCPYSDHCAVLFKCAIPSPLPRGPGRWKLNTSILKESAFISSVQSFWTVWRSCKSSFPSLQTWWDRGKERIKGLAIRWSSAKSKDLLTSRSILVSLASHLKTRIDAGTVSLLPIFVNVQNKIMALDRISAEGARIRSRVRWAEEGEMSSKFFLRLEKKRGSNDWISAMREADGSLATDISSICSSWVSFYSELFTAEPLDFGIQDQLLSNLSARLSSEDAEKCEGLLVLDEVFKALEGMSDDKSPGTDGLPKEFYVACWHIVGPDLLDVFNTSFASGLLPLSQRGALISLIFKKGDRLEHKNWRPISLLNVDYKLCARTLAGRLLNVLGSVVAPEQTCGVRGRFIGENVAFLRDLVDFTTETGTPAAILSLDQEKAFDRVDWRFLFRVLTHLGFGPSFVSWVRLLYSNVRSAVLINGYISDYFFPSRGVRQGCPLSPLLYVLSMEVLAANLRAHPLIVGLRPPGLSIDLPVLSLYADDTSVISVSDAATLAVFDVYHLFERGTGSKLNLGKCEGLWLGPWRNRLDAPIAIQWTSIKIKVLGVFIGHGDMAEANWRPRIDAVARCLDAWRSRALSFSGKAIIINMLALSRIWYVASLVHMPLWVLSELERLVFNFFWSGKRDLVARNVLFHPKEAGGFSVVSIRYKVFSLLLQWVKRLSLASNGWVYLLTYWLLDRHGVPPVAFFANVSSFHPAPLPVFYVSLVQAWVALGGTLSSSDLVVSVSGSVFPVISLTCKSTYLLFLLSNPCVPHCVSKFFPSFGVLDWSMVWRSLFFMPLDRQVSDLNWKVAHGVLYTADRLASFGYSYPQACFCGYHSECPEHLFFSCPLVQSGFAWIQSLLFRASPLAPVFNVRHALFGFSSDELRCVPRVFSYLLNVCKFLVWVQRNDFRFRSQPPSAVRLIAGLKARVRFYLPLFFKRFISPRRRRFFLRHWGGNGVIGRFSGSSFVISL